MNLLKEIGMNSIKMTTREGITFERTSGISTLLENLTAVNLLTQCPNFQMLRLP
jgi:hypothetical protein